jgi:tRNA 2-thiouridine synthesizing protein B
MAILHTVNKSPFERNALDSCLGHALEGSGVLLFEDAVVAAMTGTSVADKVMSAMQGRTFYVLGPDVTARGLSEDKVLDGIKVVDYEGFVDLVAEYDKVESWL